MAAHLLEQLQIRNLSVAAAESLTGGLLCSTLVSQPGASRSFSGGVVAYATEMKTRLLGVDAGLLQAGGPVQAEVAVQMAIGAATRMQAQLGVSTTGVAGPGASEDGPAGLVFVASVFLHGDGEALVLVQECSFDGDRQQIRAAAVLAALELASSILTDPETCDIRTRRLSSFGTAEAIGD